MMKMMKVSQLSTKRLKERNAERIALRDRFVDGLMRNIKIKRKKAKRLFDEMTSYAFNKAHAISYSILTYKMAWYKRYYPLEFTYAMLCQHPKMPECAKYAVMGWDLGVAILPPHVNASMGFSIEGEGKNRFIRRGYASVKGVGEAVAKKIADGARAQEFNGITDFEERSGVPSNVVAELEKEGALSWRDDDVVKAEARWRSYARQVYFRTRGRKEERSMGSK